LVRTFQSLELFEDLTVWDNLLVACERTGRHQFFLDLFRRSRGSDVEDRARWALRVVGIEPLADRFTRDLSHGQRKLTGIARALAAQPRLLLLDEPAAGLDPHESERFGKVLRRIVDDGTAVFLIDHDMGLMMAVCDDVYVLDFGRLVAHGTPAEIRSNPDVIRAYLGTGESLDGAEPGGSNDESAPK
jgi:branched-chain amino acid transport system ATP-binding protein